MKRRYKIISEDLQKNLIDFLDEMQFDAAKNMDDKEAMHVINFCNWAIKELLDSYDGFIREEPKKKSRDDYVEETFMDWNLPEMSDEEYEKLVDQFDAFLRGWEKEYNKKNPKNKIKKRKPTFKRPNIEDISEYMSLDEIKEYLLDDSELSIDEAFELYYDEYRRVQRKKEKEGTSYKKMLKELGIKPPPRKKD